jgi:hypothetical protein
VAFDGVVGLNVQIDSMNGVYDKFPLSIGVTAIVVFILVGLAFRSLLIPLRCVVRDFFLSFIVFRSILSIAITLAYVYGLTVFVYEDGILDWLTIAGLFVVCLLFRFRVLLTMFSMCC